MKSRDKKSNSLSPFSSFKKHDSTFIFKGKHNIKIVSVPAPWRKVLLFALVNALAVNLVKTTWIVVFGTPNVVYTDNKDL